MNYAKFMQSENAAREISLNYSSVQPHCLTENLSRNFFECLYIASSVKRMHVLMVDVIIIHYTGTILKCWHVLLLIIMYEMVLSMAA